MPHPQLNKAPIVEGLVNIQIRPIVDFASPALSQLRDALKSSYSKSADLFHAEFKIMEPGKIPQPSFAPMRAGYRLEKQTPPFVLLLQTNGLTVSRLAPYTNWGELIGEARPLWEKYVEMCKPETVTRVATRYINRVELPIAGLDFNDYLTAGPKVPNGIPDVVGQFLNRIIVPDAATGADIAVTQVIESVNAQTGKVGLMIDIDAYKEVDFRPEADDTWQLLDSLRDLKNRAFFGSLTQKAMDLFQ